MLVVSASRAVRYGVPKKLQGVAKGAHFSPPCTPFRLVPVLFFGKIKGVPSRNLAGSMDKRLQGFSLLEAVFFLRTDFTYSVRKRGTRPLCLLFDLASGRLSTPW